MNLYERGHIKNSTLLKKAIEKGLKVGYVDIETSPYLVYTYPTYKAFIGQHQVEEESKVTSAVLMLEADKVPWVFQWEFLEGKGDDSSMLEELVEELNKCDIIVAQNGDSFDIKVLQNRVKDLGLTPLKNIITLDTLKVSRRSFKQVSHSLDARSRKYGYGGKIKQDMDDCIAVAKGDKKKQAIRIKYNIKDVTDMRKVFFKELDYYSLPLSFLNLLRTYVKETREYCKKCAARRQKKFEIHKVYVKIKSGGKRKQVWECKNCLYHWNIK